MSWIVCATGDSEHHDVGAGPGDGQVAAEVSAEGDARRRVLARRCGLLPPRGLVTRNHTGSWDTDAPVAAVYRHTELGRLVVETLSRFWVWKAAVGPCGRTKVTAGIDNPYPLR